MLVVCLVSVEVPKENPLLGVELLFPPSTEVAAGCVWAEDTEPPNENPVFVVLLPPLNVEPNDGRLEEVVVVAA